MHAPPVERKTHVGTAVVDGEHSPRVEEEANRAAVEGHDQAAGGLQVGQGRHPNEPTHLSILSPRRDNPRAVTPRALLAAALLLLAGCGLPGRGPAPDPAAAFPLTLTDDAGVRVTIRRRPARIVAVAPHLTEVLFAVGAGDRVAGASGGETHPPEAMVLPRVTGDDGLADGAAILALRPDLVLAAVGDSAWTAPVTAAGVPVVTLQAHSIAEVLADIRTVARLAGAAGPGDSLARRLEAEAREVVRGVQGRPAVTVFVESGVAYPPLVAAGPASMAGDLVARAGGRIVSADVPGPAAEWPLDRLLAADPEVYLAGLAGAGSPEAVAARAGFAGLRAVREGRVRVIDDDLLFLPGPRAVEGLRAVAGALRR